MTEVHDDGNKFRSFRLNRASLALILLVTLLLAWLLNVSKPGVQVEGCWQGCARQPTANGRSLRILSLNMLHEFPSHTHLGQRLDLIAAEIRRLNIDIALLQEVPKSRQNGDSAAYLAQQTGLNHAYLRANGNRALIGFEEGVVILSRFPLENISFTELQPQAGIFEHRVVLHALVATPQGNLDLFATHLTNGAMEINEAQTASLLSFVEKTAKHTAVIGGDFNATQDSVQIEELAARWIDSYGVSRPDDPGWTCCINDLTKAEIASIDRRVDYLFLAPTMSEAAIQEIYLVWEQPFATPDGPLWASDHLGLFLKLNISP